jgi:ribonuclease VapC
MIVVDTSALMAIALDEPNAEPCINALEDADRVLISAVTLAEALIVARNRGAHKEMKALLDGFGFEVIAVSGSRARKAARTYRLYGKGRHSAGLNFGDCFAYALAREHRCPLLFVGDDFPKTKIHSAL